MSLQASAQPSSWTVVAGDRGIANRAAPCTEISFCDHDEPTSDALPVAPPAAKSRYPVHGVIGGVASAGPDRAAAATPASIHDFIVAPRPMPTIPLPQVSAGCLAPLPRSAGAGENVGKARPAGGTPLGDKKSNPRRRRRPHNHRHPARSGAPPEAFERRSDLGNEWPACRLDAVPAVPVSQPAPRGRAVGRTVGVAARCLTARLKVPPRGWPYRERTGAAAGVIRLGADGIEDTASSSAATAAGARLSAGQPRMDGTRTSARHPRSILWIGQRDPGGRACLGP